MGSGIEMYSSIYNSLFIIGIIIIICTIGTNTPSGLTGTIIGFSFFTAGVLLLIGYLMTNILQSSSSNIFLILENIGPFVLLTGILIYIIYLLSINYDLISKGNVPDSYYNFMNIFTLLLIIQVFVFYNGMQTKEFKYSGLLSKINSMLLYFLEIINIIVVITLGTILKYFITDG